MFFFFGGGVNLRKIKVKMILTMVNEVFVLMKSVQYWQELKNAPYLSKIFKPFIGIRRKMKRGFA